MWINSSISSNNFRTTNISSEGSPTNDQVKDEMGRTCSTNGEKRNAYRILMGKPERKSPLSKPKRRWVDNIKIDLRETGWGGIDSIDLSQDRDQWRGHVNTVMNLRVP
jgi:hypothetical protein